MLGVGTVASLAGCTGDSDGEETMFDSPFEREVDSMRTYLRVSGDDAGDAGDPPLGVRVENARVRTVGVAGPDPSLRISF